VSSTERASADGGSVPCNLLITVAPPTTRTLYDSASLADISAGAATRVIVNSFGVARTTTLVADAPAEFSGGAGALCDVVPWALAADAPTESAAAPSVRKM
jgi:hypothetical protein